MISKKPYLIRAFYDWIQDSGMSPYLLVDANHEGVEVPSNYVSENGEIVLDISSQAVEGLVLSREKIRFDASFPGNILSICVPVASVLAIYCHETEEGIYFDVEDEYISVTTDEQESDDIPLVLETMKDDAASKKAPKKPKLTIVDED